MANTITVTSSTLSAILANSTYKKDPMENFTDGFLFYGSLTGRTVDDLEMRVYYDVKQGVSPHDTKQPLMARNASNQIRVDNLFIWDDNNKFNFVAVLPKNANIIYIDFDKTGTTDDLVVSIDLIGISY